MTSNTKQLVWIVSTMRAGSTLLKALLSTPEDVANLPETDFQKYRKPDAAERIAHLAPEPIILLKRPGWFNELNSYPRLPKVAGARTLVLVRDVYPTVQSLLKMSLRKLAPYAPFAYRKWLAEKYWCAINEAGLELVARAPESTRLVRYEALTARPVDITAALFQFIGSNQKEGTDTYNPPGDYAWKWGSDDGGERIRKLQVMPPRPIHYKDQKLLQWIKSSERIQRLRNKIGYPSIVV